MPPWVALAIRLRPGEWEYVRVNVNALVVEELTVPEFLQFKEVLVNGTYVLLAHIHNLDISNILPV